MTSPTAGSAPGHAFISYVREDSDEVDRLQELLEASGVSVWRDKDQLWPGQDWKIEIQRAITTGSLAFLACFSRNSEARDVTYQSEELIVAVEQIRLRRPGKQWFFPVLFDRVGLPSYDLGAGRTLDSLQRTELFDDRREAQTARLITTVVRLLDSSYSSASLERAYADDPTSFMKATLLDPAKQIQLEEFVSSRTKSVITSILDRSAFSLKFPQPVSNTAAIRFVAEQADRYFGAVEPLIDVLIAGCRWGRQEHYRLWTKAMKTLANAPQELSGHSALVELQGFPKIPLLYASALSSVERGDFGGLKAVAIDTPVRRREDREALPLVSASYPWRPFMSAQRAADVLAFSVTEEVTDADIANLETGRKGRRHTPVSDYLHDKLRPHFVDEVPNDDDFIELFDLTEIYLGLLAADDLLVAKQRNQRVAESGTGTRAAYRDGPWYGQSSWRHRYWGGGGPEVSLREEAEIAGSQWPPLQAGLFGGSQERAMKAFEYFISEMQQIRGNRH